MEEPLPPLAATLRKVGEWTKLPHARFVVLRGGSPAAPPRLEYWLSPSHARGGAAPKGGGSLVAVLHRHACSSSGLAASASVSAGREGVAPPVGARDGGAVAEREDEAVRRVLRRLRPPLVDRGNFHLSLRRLHRAEADFSAALHLCGTSAALWNDRAAARFEAGRVREALADVESALALRPDFAEALSNRGNIWRALGDERKAREDYGAALLLAPTDARTWNNRAALHADAGKCAAGSSLIAASLDLKRALELDEEYVKAAENYERVAAQLAMLEPEFELQPLR
ncbi:hypothetical protein AB1Y20_005729 [Prymnesium parvum]|uniref:Uncharacterized protein n=1 Tax=Prymnesium parvum TaxID=97485 RepID=A0AB34J0K4_PRYPA